MTAAALLASLRGRGIALWLDDGIPKLSPREAMSEADWQALRAVRDEVVVLLGEPLCREEICGGIAVSIYGRDNNDLEENVRQARRMVGVWSKELPREEEQ